MSATPTAGTSGAPDQEELAKLLPIAPQNVGGELIQTVDARKLHAALGVGKDFSTWITGRIEQYNFVEDQDFTFDSPVSGNQSGRGGDRRSKNYHLTLDMAKELAMVERNDAGKRARLYFLACERRAKAQPETDPAVALNDPAHLRHLLLGYTERVIELEQKVQADKPKTAFYDRFCNADGSYGLQNAGRAFGIGPNKFVQMLKGDGILFYQGTALVPKVQYRRYFDVKCTIIDDKARYQTYVTPLGMQYLARRFGLDRLPLGNDPLPTAESVSEVSANV